MTKKCTNTHPCHSKEIKNLNRAIGQLEGIKKMIDDRRYCVDIMQQLKAVTSAIKSIETNILGAHLESCIKETFESEKQDEIDIKIDELKAILKRH